MKAILFVLICLLAADGLCADDAVAPKAGTVVFKADFEAETERARWSSSPIAQWVQTPQVGYCLRVQVPPARAGESNMIRRPLDLRPYRNCRLLFECRAKAEGVSKPSQRYLGVKFMLHYVSAAEGPFWRNQNDVWGTFDWKPLRFSASISADATEGEIDLGLQDCAGTAWFDDIRVTVVQGPPPSRPEPSVNPGPPYKGHDLPRLRGVMSPNQFRDEDLRVLGREWNANLIRWQITRNWGRAGTDRDLEDYDRWFESELQDLDKALDACRRYGLLAVIDMHTPCGGRYENRDLAIFHEPRYQDHWVALWEKTARRYKGHPAVWAYDLVNEPVQNLPSPPGVPDYLGAQVRAAKAIRAIDPETTILIEAGEWDSAAGFRYLQPVDVPRVVYQVHMYVPGSFTHQGIHGQKTGVKYPGEIGGEHWDKERLRKVLAPVREFQLAYNVHIYCGEFSAIRWAPGAAQYLSDCIDLFEEYDWDWTYHAYREWDGWSVEHGPDPKEHAPTEEPTDRKRLLLRWFAKNQKPPR